MSRSVDERVVQMKFDNKDFEKNTKESLSTLEKLKSSLNFDKAEKSAADLGRTLNRFDLSNFSKNIDNISNRFSIFGIAADQIIRRLTDGFIGLIGQTKNLVTQFSTAQIPVGWGKYAEKTAAVQTIMAATARDFEDAGEQMEYVNENLEKLLWFTDETSYDFLTMTSNIGKFTSYNIDLETAETAMMGIANWAAVSGANASTASQVMEQLSQALGTGVIKWQDWQSVATRNMATAEAKEIFLEAAAAVGTLTKVGEKSYKTLEGNIYTVEQFKDSLQDNWFTTEAFLKGLSDYGTFTDLLYEASNAFEDQYDTVKGVLDALDDYRDGVLDVEEVASNCGKTVEEVNEIFSKLADPSMALGEKAFRLGQEAKTFQEAIDYVKGSISTGWMTSFELIFGDYEEGKKLWSNLADSLWDLFASGQEERNNILKEWHNSRHGGYDDFVEGISDLIEAMLNIKERAKELIEFSLFPIINLNKFDANFLSDIVLKFKEFSKNLKIKTFAEDSDGLWELIDAAKEYDEVALNRNHKGFLLFDDKELNSEENKILEIYNSADDIRSIFFGLARIIRIVGKGFITLKNSLSPLVKVFSALKGFFLDVAKGLSHVFLLVDMGTKATDGFKDSIDGICTKIADFITKWGGKIKDFFYKTFTWDEATQSIKISSNALDDFKAKLDGLMEITWVRNLVNAFKWVWDVIKIGYELIKKIVTSIPKLFPNLGKAISNLGQSFLSFIGTFGEFISGVLQTASDSGALDAIVEFISGFFAGIADAFKDGGIATVIEKITDIISAILGLESAYNFERGMRWFVDIFGTLSDIPGIIYYNELGRAFLKLGIALFLLSLGMKSLASIDSDKLTQATIALAGILGVLAVFISVINKISGAQRMATGGPRGGLFGSYIDMLFGERKQGTKFITGNLSGYSELGSMLIKIAAAVLIFSIALKKLGALDVKQMIIAVVGLAAILGITAGFLATLKSISGETGIAKINAIALGMIGIAASLVIFAASMKIIGTMKWEDLAKAGVTISFVLGAIIGLFAAVGGIGASSAKFAVVSASILLISDAFIILAGAMKIIGTANWEDLAKFGAVLVFFSGVIIGLGAVATYFAVGFAIAAGVMIAAALSLVIATPSILALVGVITLLGEVPMNKITKALFGLGGAMLILALTMGAIDPKGAMALSIAVPALMALVGALGILGGFETNTLIKALLTMGAAILSIAVASILLLPAIPVLLSLSAAALMVGLGMNLAGGGLIMFATGLAIMSKVGVAGARTLVASLKVLLVGLVDLGDELCAGIVALIASLCGAILQSVPQIIDTIGTLLLTLLNWLWKHSEEIAAALAGIIKGIIKGITAYIGGIIDVLIILVVEIIDGLANAINKNEARIQAAIENLFRSLLSLGLTILGASVKYTVPFGNILAKAIYAIRDYIVGKMQSEEETTPKKKNNIGLYTRGPANINSSTDASEATSSLNTGTGSSGIITDLTKVTGENVNIFGDQSISDMGGFMSMAEGSIPTFSGDISDYSDYLSWTSDLPQANNNLEILNNSIKKQNAQANRAGMDSRSINPIESTTNNTKNYGDFTININAPEGMDAKELAEYVMDEIQSETSRREAALA